MDITRFLKPERPQKKEFWTNAGGALISGISGLFGVGASAASSRNALKSARETNQTNLQISRETNDANLRLARDQNDWNLDMWNKQNEYNTASAQKQRMLDAGLNPLGQNFTDGNAGSLQSANLANQQSTQLDPNAEASAHLAGGQALAAAAQNYFNNVIAEKNAIKDLKMKDKQIEGQEIANRNQQIEGMYLGGYLAQRNRGEQARNDYQYLENKFARDSFNMRLDEIASQIHKTDAERVLTYLQSVNQSELNKGTWWDNALKQKVVKWYDKIQSANLKESLMRASLSGAQVQRIQTLLPYEVASSEGAILSLEQDIKGKILDNFERFGDLNTKGLERYIAKRYGISAEHSNQIVYNILEALINADAEVYDIVNGAPLGTELKRRMNPNGENDITSDNPIFMKSTYNPKTKTWGTK